MVHGVRSTQSFTKKKGSLTRINLESKWAINFIRKLISDNSDKSIFFEHEIHERNGTFRISCFRHLEKPIKTKENRVKHFVFICFYWFSPVFLKGESNIFQTLRRRDTEFFIFFRTRNTRMERKFRLFCVFRVHVYINHRYS